MKKCTGENCPMQMGYDFENCAAIEKCPYRTWPVTVADRIRSMTDNELAGMLFNFRMDSIMKVNVFDNGSIQNWLFEHMKRSCLTYEELADYIGNGKTGHGWHISDLRIYDQPQELTAFRRACPNSWYCESCAMYWKNNGTCGNESLYIKRPPQSWCYVEEG